MTYQKEIAVFSFTRAARRCSPQGRFLQPKTIIDGITIALVEEPVSLTCVQGGKRRDSAKEREIPRVLMFGGTTESLTLLKFLQKFRMDVYLSVATEYGKESVPENVKAKVLCGRMDGKEILAFLKEHSIDLVVDATHPFATEVTENILWACKSVSAEYIRCLREETQLPKRGTKKRSMAVYVSSTREAVEYLKNVKGNIFRKESDRNAGTVFKRDEYCGDPLCRRFLFCHEGVGNTGGMKEKMEACIETGITVVMIMRPKEKGSSIEEVCNYFDRKYADYRL